MKIYTNVDLRYNTINNASIQRSQPANPKEGTIYYNAGQNAIMYYDGSEWIKIGGGSETLPSDNILEQVNISVGSNTTGTNLTINNSKAVKLNFSTTGQGDLKIKDINANQFLGTLNIVTPGITIGEFLAVGTLPRGYQTYIFKHEFETDYLIVQILDKDGYTVVCDVQRIDQSFIKVEFSQKTDNPFTIVVTGNKKYSPLELSESRATPNR